MMAFFNGTKTTKLLTAFVLILSLVITYAAPMSVYAEDDSTPTKDFKVNLFNYDKTKVNTADLEIANATKSSILAFHGTTETGYGQHSTYHGSSSDPTVFTGIVDDSLNSNGRVKFKSGIDSIDLFSTDSSDYVSYPNVIFPIAYNSSTGYYEYNSKVQSATFDSDSNKIDIGTGPNGGFWPFGRKPATGTQTGDFHFGLNMSVDFYIPQHRTVDGTEGGAPLIFTFKGDDDVWIFIDDKLVLDLGGIHNAAEGKINFTTGEVTTPKSTTTGAGMVTNSFVENLKASKPHNLKIFYLERGAGESNLQMNFNIPPVEPLSVEKKLDGDFGTSDDFHFVIQLNQKDHNPSTAPGEFDPGQNLPYTIHKDGVPDRNGTTDSNGGFTLKANEKAIFSTIPDDTWFRVYEVINGSYINKWNPLPNGHGIQSSSSGGNAVVGKYVYGAEPGDYALVCTNMLAATNVTFTKCDQDTRQIVPGAAFQLIPSSGAITGIVTAVSDDDGVVTFYHVPIGTYKLKEISAPPGYRLDDTEYTVDVARQMPPAISAAQYIPASYSGENGYQYVYFRIKKNGQTIDNVILNEKKLIDLTITKKVQGSYAPENTPAGGPSGDVPNIMAAPTKVLYPFTIHFSNGYTIASPEAIVSSGAFDFSGPVIDRDSEDFVYTFKLEANGTIALPVKSGVRYTVTEDESNDDTYRPYMTLSGDEKIEGDTGYNAVSAISTTTSSISVLNQYPNDGLTILKSVTGNTAVSGAAYSFKAKFWVPETKNEMEKIVKEEAGKKAGDAETSLGAVRLTEEEATSLAALQADVEAAGVDVEKYKGIMDLAKQDYDKAAKDLSDANTSKSAMQADYDATSNPAILVDIEALGIDGLKDTKADMETAYGEAQSDYEKAVLAEKNAKLALEKLLNDNPKIKEYLDAQAAYESAQAAYNALSDQETMDENILQRIWNRVVGFFIDLIVGEPSGEGVDIACTGSAADFKVTSNVETSDCAFSLKNQETATFNFDDYFIDHPNFDRVYFEITETDSRGAERVTIGTEDGDRLPGTPEMKGTVIKGYVDRGTENPIIEYTNVFENKMPRDCIVNHWTDKGVLLASDSSIKYSGDEYHFGPSDFTDYTFSTASAIGISETPAADGTITGTIPKGEGNIVITYIYTAKSSGDTPTDNRPNRRNRTVVNDEPTPAAPVTPEAINPPATSSVVDEVIPAGPLPKTGGVAPYLLYGLGLLLAGGGVALKRKEK